MELTYHDAYERLAVLVSEIEDDDLQLDRLAAKIKEAKELIIYCEQKLRGIQQSLSES